MLCWRLNTNDQSVMIPTRTNKDMVTKLSEIYDLQVYKCTYFNRKRISTDFIDELCTCILGVWACLNGPVRNVVLKAFGYNSKLVEIRLF